MLNYGSLSVQNIGILDRNAYNRILYIIPNIYAEHQDVKEMLEQATFIGSKEYSYRGWNVMVYEVEIG